MVVGLLKQPIPSLESLAMIDVGACLGTSAIPATKYFSKVYAIEPARENYERLCENVRLNRLDNRVETSLCAIGEYSGSVHLSKEKEHNCGTWYINRHCQGGGEKVKQVELKKFCGTRDLHNIGLVWADCQGSEARLLWGAIGCLESCPFYLEVCPHLLGDDVWLLNGLVLSRFRTFIDVFSKRRVEMPISDFPDLAVEKFTNVLLFP